MRHALNRTLIHGRHRLGRPGLVPVTAFAQVVRHSILTRWFHRGRHLHPQMVPGTVTVLPGPSAAGRAARRTELTAA